MAANSSNHPLRRLTTQLNQLWTLLIEPSDRIQDAEERRRARLLSVFLLAFIPSILVITQWLWLGEGFRIFFSICTISLSVTYLLTRRGRYQLAAVIVTFIMSITPIVFFVLLLNDSTVRGATITLIWTAAALFIGYLLFGLRGTVVTVVANLLSIAVLPIFFSAVGYDEIVYVLFFNVVVACEVLIAALIRGHYTTYLTSQSRALQESEERFRDLFTATMGSIVVHENGIILDANPAFEDLSGYSLAELSGASVLRFIPEQDRAIVEAAQSSTETYVARGIRKNGTVFWFEASAQFQTYRGRQVRVASIQDITERKQAEERNLELAVEREKVAVLQRFIGDMSHDLRTPLSVIKTSIYLLEKLAHDPVKFKQSLETLDSQTDHLQRLIEDLLSMSRLDKAETSDYRFVWCNLNTLIQEAIDEQHTMAIRKHVNLRFEPAAAMPPVLVDHSEFKKMIKHLILNGINYTPEEGSVTITTQDSSRFVIVEVTDTGAGIAPLDLPHVFDRFYRADRARSTEQGGTGLGLTIARKIVEAHGGTIEARSQFKHGSTFRVSLPKIPTNQSAAAAQFPLS